jgi:hypothetical protein
MSYVAPLYMFRLFTSHHQGDQSIYTGYTSIIIVGSSFKVKTMFIIKSVAFATSVVKIQVRCFLFRLNYWQLVLFSSQMVVVVICDVLLCVLFCRLRRLANLYFNH